MKNRCGALVGMVAALAMLSLIAYAQEPVEREPAVQHELITELQRSPVEYRAAIKKSLDGHLAAFGLLLMMRAPENGDLPKHSAALVWLSRTHEALYVEDSATEATSDRIWSQPEEFAEAAGKTTEHATRLNEAVAGGNRHLMLNALVRLGESCEACHAQFRIASD